MSSPITDQPDTKQENGHLSDHKGSDATADSQDASTTQHSAAHSATLNGTMPPSPTANKSNGTGQHHAEPSFLSKLLHILVPCISSTAHPIEHESQPPNPRPQQDKPTSKPVDNEKAAIAQEQKSGPSKSSSPADLLKPLVVDADPRPVTPPAVGDDAEVILPPTPTTHLLPPEETEGMTSGAVQPPGSKGDSPIHDKPHTTPPHEENEESEGSYTDEDLEEPEDDEDRLILDGGAGIPIGPVSWSCIFRPITQRNPFIRMVSPNLFFLLFPLSTQDASASCSTWMKLWFTVASRLVFFCPRETIN